jgi:hypothetical protein
VGETVEEGVCCPLSTPELRNLACGPALQDACFTTEQCLILSADIAHFGEHEVPSVASL